MNNVAGSLTDILNKRLDVESSFVEKTYEADVRYAFDLGALGLFIPEKISSELIETPELAFMPKMPGFVEGLCNVRGNLIPVFNLHKKLLSQENIKTKYLLALGEGDDIVGVLLESLPYVVREEAYTQIQRTPDLPVQLEQHVFRAFQKDGKVLLEYDHNAFFLSLCH